MPLARAALVARIVLLSLVAATAVTARAGEGACYAVDVRQCGPERLARLTSDPDVRWWAELGDVLVVDGTAASRARAAERLVVTDLEGPGSGERLYLTRHIHPSEISRPTGAEARVVVASGILAVVAAAPEAAAELADHGHGSVTPLGRGVTYARSSANEAARPAAVAKTARDAADAVDPERWRASVEHLVSLGTRYVGTAGADAARDYFAAEFEQLGLSVSIVPVDAGGRLAYNVVAELPGALTPYDVYIVCGHYDSISERPSTLAPGAEDNGSGSAGVLELARIFAERRPAATIRFIAFSGEELGLYGSEHYVDHLVESGEVDRVRGVVNMDMIAFSRDDDLDVLLETSSAGTALADALAAGAAATSLRVVRSLDPFGSDHVPFLRRGIPCVLTIENDWDEYPDYHTSRDGMENVRLDMGGEVLRMNAATLAALAGDASTGAAVTLGAPNGSSRLYGGFAQLVSWTSAGDAIASIDVELSVDGGASYAPLVTGLDATRRVYLWMVPSDLDARDGRIRVVAHTTAGAVVADASDQPIDFRPSNGPTIRKVRFKNGNLVLTGRFGHEFSQIYIDDFSILATEVPPRHVDGNTTKRLTGIDSQMATRVPRGVPVRIRVVDLRTGQATPEFTYTR
jgi:hypothetical protein